MSQDHKKTFVMKFGGSSLGGSKEILQSVSIVKKYSGQSKLIVVCSAMGDTTDRLLKAIDHAKKGDLEKARKTISDIRISIEKAIDQTVDDSGLRQQCAEWAKERFDEIDRVLLGISLLRDLSPRSLDYFLSFGEKLSTSIVTAALSSAGLRTRYLTGGEAGIVTDETFGSAEPVLKVTNEKLKASLLPLIDDSVIPVVTGYIAETLEGHEVITLGRGGSDYTATLIAAAIDADEVLLWTDVDGIMSADPRIIHNARILEQISYLEAMEMSAFGAKAMQPRALEPAARKGIPVRIKNTFNPEVPGTLILSTDDAANGVKTGVKAVGSLTNVGVVNISGTSIVGSPGTAVKIFEILKEHGVGILMMSQSVSENNVSLVIRRNELPKIVRALKKDLLMEDPEVSGSSKNASSRENNTKFSKVDYEDDVSIVAVLGRGMIGTPGIAGRVFSTVAKQGINIRMIAQGSSEINISFVIKDKDRNRAVSALHEEFVEKPLEDKPVLVNKA
ncbi:MAG TPA: aspartate kinase [Nitrososphaerales archaeon]|nr:aspartate kinase [Nitrososphaerales archaeon]